MTASGGRAPTGDAAFCGPGGDCLHLCIVAGTGPATGAIMSNLSLRRLTDLLNALISRCDAAFASDGSALDDEARRKRIEIWFDPAGTCPLEVIEEAATLCERLGLDGAATKLREDGGQLLIDWTDICFHDVAPGYNADQIEFLQQVYGRFPMPLADAKHDEELNRA